MFGKNKEKQDSEPNVLTVADFETILHDTFDKSSIPDRYDGSAEMDMIKSRIPTFDEQDTQYRYDILKITGDYFKQRRRSKSLEKMKVEKIKQDQIEEELRIKKTNYIDEKSKLTEKQLLAEIIMLLENIRDDVKMNSVTMDKQLQRIINNSGDVKNELKYSREEDKERHKENMDTTWEIS
jgi:hypothetical protein